MLYDRHYFPVNYIPGCRLAPGCRNCIDCPSLRHLHTVLPHLGPLKITSPELLHSSGHCFTAEEGHSEYIVHSCTARHQSSAACNSGMEEHQV